MTNSIFLKFTANSVLTIYLLMVASAPRALAETLTLQGRIEEVFNQPTVKLPVGLTAKAGKLVFEPPASRINQVAQQLKSFPALMRGEWKGQLEVTRSDFTDDFKKALPEEVRFEEPFFTIGRKAQSSFRFFAERGKISMTPPVVQFWVNSEEAKSTARRALWIYLETDNAAGKTWRSNSGESRMQGRLIKNQVTQLGPSTIEQDTVVLVSLVNEKTRQRCEYVSEHIFQFEKRTSFNLRVSVAEVLFDSSGRLWKRMLLTGDAH